MKRRKEYAVTIEMHFKTAEDRDEFFGRYLYGGGEQHIECYAHGWELEQWMEIDVKDL